MSRPLRIQYPDAWYHVMNRGRRGEKIFVLWDVVLWDVQKNINSTIKLLNLLCIYGRPTLQIEMSKTPEYWADPIISPIGSSKPEWLPR